MNLKTRYISHFATDFDAVHEVGGWKHLEDAKKLCERQFSLDFFGSPRVYVEELIEYPEDDIHESAAFWERVGFHEFDGQSWHQESL